MSRGLGLVLALAVLAPAPGALAQDDPAATLEARADRVPSGRRTFRETWLLPPGGGTAAGPEGLEFAARVTVLQEGGRERIEIAAIEDGALAAPRIVVGDGSDYWLVTKVGATPFLESAVADDPLVGLVLASPPGAAAPHRTVEAEGGGIRAVVLRHAGPVDFDADRAFAIRETALGGGVVARGLSSFSAAGDRRVVAAAGARGVDRVRTATGTVSVTPDPAAVAWMDSVAVDATDLEAFRREGRLPPWQALPEPAAGEDGR